MGNRGVGAVLAAACSVQPCTAHPSQSICWWSCSKCPYSQCCFSANNWRGGWEKHKSHWHECSCEVLSMVGVFVCTRCFLLNMLANDWLSGKHRRKSTLWCYSYCTQELHSEGAQPLPQETHVLMWETRIRWENSGKREALVVMVMATWPVGSHHMQTWSLWAVLSGCWQCSWEKAQGCWLEKWVAKAAEPTGGAEWDSTDVASQQQKSEFRPASRAVPAICAASQKGLKFEFQMSDMHSNSVTRKLQSEKQLWKSFGGVWTITGQHLGKSSTCP